MGLKELHRRRSLGGSTPTPDQDVFFSLRKKYSWDKSFIKVRRSNDDATAYVFFDGAIAYSSINLNSYISTVSDTTPSATTLTSWAGANNVFVERWIGMNPDNVINTEHYSENTILAQQPQLLSAGAFMLLNGKPAIYFYDSALTSYEDTVEPPNSHNINALDPGKEFTILTVSNNIVNNGNAGVFTTIKNGSPRITLFHERNATKRIYQVTTDVSNYTTNYLAQQNTSNQKLLSCTMTTAKYITSYFNGTSQTGVQVSGDWGNTNIRIGSNTGNLTLLRGHIQEIWVRTSISDIATDHADINSYYSIY